VSDKVPQEVRMTEQLASFAAALQYEDIPERAIASAKLGLLDLLGVSLYGARTSWCRILQDYISERPGATSSGAVVWGTSFAADPAAAALVNGTAGHSAELDDLHKASFYHPSAATVPAAVALADVQGNVSGRELLTALVAGYEVGARVGMALGQGHFLRGYHPQGSVGVFAAAAAAARILKLGPEGMRNALGIAGTQASGLMAAQEGAMVKRLHAGLACETGVRAALLAAKGFTGIDDVLEAPFGGLLSTLGTDASDASALTGGLGTQWETEAIEFKIHAACAAIHSALDALQVMALPSNPSDVESVTIRTSTHSYLHCGFDYLPVSATSAQMSYQYCVAALLRFGRVSLAEFADDLLADPELLTLAGRVRVVADPEIDRLGPAGRHAVAVAVHTKHDGTLEGHRAHRRGGVDDPWPAELIVAKYREIAALSGVSAPAQIEALVLGLEQCKDVAELTALLAGAHGG